MKIAITGASGHVGANLCRTLLEKKHSVKVLVNKFSKSIDSLNLEKVQGNLLDPDSLKKLADGSEIFIHLAASISINGNQDVFDTNVKGTQNVINVCRDSGIKRLIHFSSIHALVHDPLDEILDETSPLAIRDHIIYNRSKALAEQAIQQAAAGGLDVVVINPTSVMGPNDFKPSLIGQAILQLYQGKIPALVPGGYDWVDVRDVVSGTIKAIEKGRTGESYLLSGHYLSLPDLYEMLLELRGNGKKLPLIPFWLAKTGVPFLKLWAMITRSNPLYTSESIEILKTAHKNISSEKASKEFGYSSRPFKETLQDTIEWFKENDYL